MSRNAHDVLMLRAKRLWRNALSSRIKTVLEAEKERDKIHKEPELIEVQLPGKRAHTHDDTGDGHEMLSFVEFFLSNSASLGPSSHTRSLQGHIFC